MCFIHGHKSWSYKDIINFAGTQAELCACVCVSVFGIHYNIALSAKPRCHVNSIIYPSRTNDCVTSETERFVALMLSKFSYHKEWQYAIHYPVSLLNCSSVSKL